MPFNENPAPTLLILRREFRLPCHRSRLPSNRPTGPRIEQQQPLTQAHRRIGIGFRPLSSAGDTFSRKSTAPSAAKTGSLRAAFLNPLNRRPGTPAKGVVAKPSGKTARTVVERLSLKEPVPFKAASLSAADRSKIEAVAPSHPLSRRVCTNDGAETTARAETVQ